VGKKRVLLPAAHPAAFSDRFFTGGTLPDLNLDFLNASKFNLMKELASKPQPGLRLSQIGFLGHWACDLNGFATFSVAKNESNRLYPS